MCISLPLTPVRQTESGNSLIREYFLESVMIDIQVYLSLLCFIKLGIREQLLQI